jgi:hypothetical protein
MAHLSSWVIEDFLQSHSQAHVVIAVKVPKPDLLGTSGDLQELLKSRGSNDSSGVKRKVNPLPGFQIRKLLPLPPRVFGDGSFVHRIPESMRVTPTLMCPLEVFLTRVPFIIQVLAIDLGKLPSVFDVLGLGDPRSFIQDNRA